MDLRERLRTFIARMIPTILSLFCFCQKAKWLLEMEFIMDHLSEPWKELDLKDINYQTYSEVNSVH